MRPVHGKRRQPRGGEQVTEDPWAVAGPPLSDIRGSEARTLSPAPHPQMSHWQLEMGRGGAGKGCRRSQPFLEPGVQHFPADTGDSGGF